MWDWRGQGDLTMLVSQKRERQQRRKNSTEHVRRHWNQKEGLLRKGAYHLFFTEDQSKGKVLKFQVMQVRQKEKTFWKNTFVTGLRRGGYGQFQSSPSYRVPARGQSCWPHSSSSNPSKAAHTSLLKYKPE